MIADGLRDMRACTTRALPCIPKVFPPRSVDPAVSVERIDASRAAVTSDALTTRESRDAVIAGTATSVLEDKGNTVESPYSHRAVRTLVLVIAASVLAGLSSSARAELGGSASSVASDANQLGATLRSLAPQSALFSVNEMTIPSGTTVREYVGPNGTVFGIAWEGPTLPDLRLLLGSHFERYAATQSANARRGARSPLSVNERDLVVFSGGQLRAFSGRAFLPQAVPSGVDVNVIR